jgi:hypothetical protein
MSRAGLQGARLPASNGIGSKATAKVVSCRAVGALR